MSTLPAGWTETSLPEVCSKITDGTHHSPVNLTTGAFKYVTAKNIRPWGLDLRDITYVNAETHREVYARCPVEKGDVLYIKDGATTGLAIVNSLDEPFTMLSSVALIKPIRALLDASFLKHWLNSPETLGTMLNQMTGTAIRRLTLTTISAQTIRVPPLSEQRRIVAEIDNLSSKSKRARDNLDHVPPLVEKYKQAVLGAMFRHEVGSRSAWPTKPFFEVLDFKGGSQPPKSTFFPSPAPGLVRLLQIRDFGSDDKAVYIQDASRWPKCTVQDIMVGRYGASVGKILTGKAGAYNVALVKMIFDPRILDRQFVYRWLQADDFQTTLKLVSRSAQNGFNKSDLEALNVLVPPLARQREIVCGIERAFNWIDRLTSEATSARKLIDHLDQAILAKAFRGELVPQDPNDEPASVLLERIKEARAAEADKVQSKRLSKAKVEIASIKRRRS
jgi:type I restriction enzyme, S subunit